MEEQSRKSRAAQLYAARGWSVLPLHWIYSDGSQSICSCNHADCPRPGKHPIHATGVRGASNDPAVVKGWWRTYPDANIGIATGKRSGVVVLDLDGPEADATIREGGLDLPEGGPVVSTGKGRHYYMECPGDGMPNFVKRLPGIDLRGDGGYVVAPPSDHISGRTYGWRTPHDAPLPEIPGWVDDIIQEHRTTTGRLPEKIGDGERNDTLARLAGYMRRKGMGTEAIFLALREENQARCEPPLPEDEVRVIAESVSRYKPALELLDVDVQDDAGPDGAPPPPPQKGTLPQIPSMPGGYHLTDLGNAQRLMAEFGQEVYYIPQWGKWVLWNGRNWAKDENEQIMQYASQVPPMILRDAAVEKSRNAKLLLVRHALATEAAGKLGAMVKLSQPMRSVAVTEFDTEPALFNAANGIVDLRTGEMTAHDRTRLMMKASPVAYEPEAECPKFLAFMDRIMGGNAELVNWLQKALGYALTGETGEQCFFVFYGSGANGKSTLLEVVKYVAGDYARTANFATFAEKPASSGPSEDIARLVGSRFVTAVESGQGLSFAESLLKTLTGSELVAARMLYQETFEYRPGFKIFFGTNHKPGIKNNDEGIWRRIRLVPFKVMIPVEERVQNYADVLIQEEAPGILAWLVAGAMRWYSEGLGVPREVQNATGEYRDEMDTFQDFADRAFTVEDGARVSAGDLYECYQVWCDEVGEKPLSNRWFGLKMTELGFGKAKANGAVFRTGLKLRDDAPKRKPSGNGQGSPLESMLD